MTEQRWADVDAYLEDVLVLPDPELAAAVIQTVGSKGYDGFALALVTG